MEVLGVDVVVVVEVLELDVVAVLLLRVDHMEVQEVDLEVLEVVPHPPVDHMAPLTEVVEALEDLVVVIRLDMVMLEALLRPVELMVLRVAVEALVDLVMMLLQPVELMVLQVAEEDLVD